VEVIGPDRFRTISCPAYPDIALSLWPRGRAAEMIEDFTPDALHIATKGRLASPREAGRAGAALHSSPHSSRGLPKTSAR